MDTVAVYRATRGPVWTCGFIAIDDRVRYAAPLIYKHVIGYKVNVAIVLLEKQGWQVEKLSSRVVREPDFEAITRIREDAAST